MKLAGGEHGIKPERRMIGLLWLVLLEPIGLFAFAWTSLGPPEVHWIAPLIFVAMIGIANLAIYQATCDYMVRSLSSPHLEPKNLTLTLPPGRRLRRVLRQRHRRQRFLPRLPRRHRRSLRHAFLLQHQTGHQMAAPHPEFHPRRRCYPACRRTVRLLLQGRVVPQPLQVR
jgi:hypothetical protein